MAEMLRDMSVFTVGVMVGTVAAGVACFTFYAVVKCLVAASLRLERWLRMGA